MSRKSGKTKFITNKLGTTRPSFKKNFKKHNLDQKGFWPTHQFIRKDDEKTEINIKRRLCPDGGIDVNRIDDMMNPIDNNIDILLRRHRGGEKLKKADIIKINNYLEKIDREVERDIKGIDISRFNHTPKTTEGKFMMKMLWLERVLKSGREEKIAHMFLKIKDDNDDLNKLRIPESKKVKYQRLISEMNDIIDEIDMIDMQLNELSNSVTPLNQKGFVKLEDFQEEVIKTINENELKPLCDRKSIIVKAPTSAGKSALGGYLFTRKGRFIVSVPTNALAWQLAAYISNIIGSNVPIITDTFQSSLKTSDLVTKILNSRCVVGTPKEMVDILALPDFKDIVFDWMMLDEIHMLGKKEGAEMEHLIKAYPETPILALSATIGNEEMLAEWFKNCGKSDVKVIVYEKRFINLQRFNFNNKTKKIDRINPLSMIPIEDFKSGIVIEKSLIPTPQDVYSIYQDLIKTYPEKEELKHQNFFDPNKRLSLNDIIDFFNHHLKFMVKRVQEDDEKMVKMINHFKLNDFIGEDVNFVDMLFTIKEEKKAPAIVFHKNSSVILDYAYKIHKEIQKREDEKYPKLMEERMKHNKRFKQQQKKDDRDETLKKIADSNVKTDKIEMRMNKKLDEKMSKEEIGEKINEKDIFEPHKDFIFNDIQYFNKTIVEGWEYNVNPNKDKFFVRDGDRYHWMIDLLYRGFGVYCKGLPDPYLRIVQQLAKDKMLAFVFSDKELVFGVSMPFRTAIILDDDSLDSMEYHQMAGRAGRRGLDKEGNVVFAGFSSDRIKELSVSIIPNVTGSFDCLNYGVKIGNKLSQNGRWLSIQKNMLVSKCNPDKEENVNEFFEDIDANTSEDGVWDYINNIDNKHLLHLMWQFRQCDEALMLPLILRHLEDGFSTARATNEGDQISVALYLLHFINTNESSGNDLPLHHLFEEKQKDFYDSMKDFDEGFGFDIPDNIDGDLYTCIKENRCVQTKCIMENHIIREKITSFINKLRAIQHYYYHMGLTESDDKSKHINICKLLGKLFTRIKWIYHTSSMLVLK